jgi:hypothetical protein
MQDLAWMYGEQSGNQRLIQMELLIERIVEKRRELLGTDHKDTLVAIQVLAWTYKQH